LKDGKFTSYTTHNGLLDDVVDSVLEDSGNNLWLGCSKGIFRVSKKESTNWRAAIPRPIRACWLRHRRRNVDARVVGRRRPRGWKARMATLWFATIKGVAMIDPERIRINEQAPPVVIEQLRIDDQYNRAEREYRVAAGKARFDFITPRRAS